MNLGATAGPSGHTHLIQSGTLYGQQGTRQGGLSRCFGSRRADGPHHVGEVRPREEFRGLLVGGDICQWLQTEELRDRDDVLVHQPQFLLQEGAVQADTLLQNREMEGETQQD